MYKLFQRLPQRPLKNFRVLIFLVYPVENQNPVGVSEPSTRISAFEAWKIYMFFVLPKKFHVPLIL